MKNFFFSFFLLFFSVFAQTATKQDIRLLREDIREQNRILREDMNKQIKILREDMNKRFEMMDRKVEILREDMSKQIEILREDVDRRFEDLFQFIGILYAINFAILGYFFIVLRRLEMKKYDIAHLAQQLYQASPEVKAKIYFHLKEEAEKYKRETFIS